MPIQALKKWGGLDCHDCGVQEGQLHLPGCDMERCPFCLEQLLSCDCCYTEQGIDCSKGSWAYQNGLTDEQTDQWEALLERKGRIPYINVPVNCHLCGEQWTELFKVSDKTWRKYVPPNLQGEVLCFDCFLALRQMFPKGWRKVKASLETKRKESHALSANNRLPM